MKNTLIVVRGCSGAGKSLFADVMADNMFPIVSADMFFMHSGEYKFDTNKLKNAHFWCKQEVEKNMKLGLRKIFVANTFTQEWEMQPYFDLAKEYEYTIFSIIVENRNNTINVHNVPNETLQKQRERFQIKL